MRRRWKRRLLVLLCVLVCGGLVTGTAGLMYLRASLPILDGELRLSGLRERVIVERDSLGIPSIQSSDRVDSAFALGFVHAQDRFFQMDLLRRLSSGRLSELFGELAVGSDASFRKHRFMQLARSVVQDLPDRHREILDAYCDGVNCGLSELSARPFEYAVLRQSPIAWEPEDTILVMLTMLCDLQSKDGDAELRYGELKEAVPSEVYDFLVRDHSQWDAALDGTVFPEPAIPGENIFALRDHPSKTISNTIAFSASEVVARESYSWLQLHDEDPEFVVGSNSWAIGGELNRDGRAILASDMHLGLRVPTIWYRAEITGPTVQGTTRRIVGVTLPGTPVLIEGSNGSVAWGFTNSYGDYGDVIELTPGPQIDDSLVDGFKETYLTPTGPKPIETVREEIRFPGGFEVIEYEWTIWGPVVAVRDGRRFVHHWVGNDPKAFDLNLLSFEGAGTVEELLEIANRTGMPHQNVTAVDDLGNTGWTLSGRIPKRDSEPPKVPVDWSREAGGWLGYLEPSDYPRVVNPKGGRIWAANNRMLGEEYLRVVGNGGFDIGARARQIRDRLFEKESFTEEDLLAIQLDDEAKFLDRWKERFLEAIQGERQIVSEECRKAVIETSERASIDSVGYRIVRMFREQVLQAIFEGERRNQLDIRELESPNMSRREPRFRISLKTKCSFEDVASQLLEARPKHWLSRDYESWEELLRVAARESEQQVTRDMPLAKASWGERNRASIRHPLSNAIGFLSGWLDMPSVPLPGDNHMPRVQSPSGGASQRMVVSPGHEELGYYHQPGGQSGHPLSPFYAKGFAQWVEGAKSPLLPGKALYVLVMQPLALD